MLLALQHWALAISTPADWQQRQILLKVQEPGQLLPPWRMIWRIAGTGGCGQPSYGSLFPCFDLLQT
jgi:hypothetical protein